MRRIAVVGGSLAGFSAARSLRAQGFDGHLVVIGDEPHRPYDRPPLSKEFLAGAVELPDISLESPEEDLALDWRLGIRATALDASTRTLTLSDASSVTADGVVLATGARARSLAGTEGLRGVHVLRNLDDAVALRTAFADAERVVVIGAGFIGAEVASTARSLGLDVTVAEALPVPLAAVLGTEMGSVCAGLHADHGVRLITGVGVTGVMGDGAVQAVRLADGTDLPADVVVVGIGVVPNVEWLAGSAVAVGNGVVTDARCATNVPNVVATGDCAASYDPAVGGLVRSEHWTHALEQPAIAAATLLGTSPPPAARLPYFWSEQYGVRLQFAGYRQPTDSVRVIEGDPDQRSFVAVYERNGEPVAVLGMNQPRVFTRWRKQLRQAMAAAAA